MPPHGGRRTPDHVRDRQWVLRGRASKRQRRAERMPDATKFVLRGTTDTDPPRPVRMSVQNTAPEDPDVGDLWVDTT